jgi:hypothetical protein
VTALEDPPQAASSAQSGAASRGRHRRIAITAPLPDRPNSHAAT